jgi:activator of 2-hydroxyglutaryl-CoA dehydratase
MSGYWAGIDSGSSFCKVIAVEDGRARNATMK